MNTIFRYATATVLTGAISLAAATPSEARNGRNAAAIGFGVGAIAGAAIAGSAYNNGYYGSPIATRPVTHVTLTRMSRRLLTATATPMRPLIRTAATATTAWLDPHRTNNFSISWQR